MNEHDKAKHMERFEKNVQWLKKNVAPDDIYEFAEQALMAADYFIGELSSWVDLVEEGEKDRVLGLWLKNVIGMRVIRDRNMQGVIDTSMKTKDEL
jgi:hypothetical protein